MTEHVKTVPSKAERGNENKCFFHLINNNKKIVALLRSFIFKRNGIIRYDKNKRLGTKSVFLFILEQC